MAILTRSPEARNFGGSIAMPTPLGVPVRIRSPGASVQVCSDEVDELLAAEDQIRGARVLAQLAVDPGLQAQVAGVGQLVDGRHPGAERAERVGALGARPLRLAALQVTGGDVVGDAEAADPAAGADHDRQLALVVQSLDDLGAVDRAAGRRDRTADLDEHDRLLGALAAGLLHVLGVVEADRVDRPRLQDGRQQLHLGQRPGADRFRGHGGAAEDLQHSAGAAEGGDAVSVDDAGQGLGVIRGSERGEFHRRRAYPVS